MQFEISINNKNLIFDSEVHGLIVDDNEYNMGLDGELIYDIVDSRKLKSDSVKLQMSSNTSTLIPALKILGLKYNAYFDQRDVVESQNDIKFYWKKSKLAAYYNKFSTDKLSFEQRESVIKSAVEFLQNTLTELPLQEEFLNEMNEECELLGFFEGLPIYNGSKGLTKLLSVIGIHIGSESIMISTPFDEYFPKVKEVCEKIQNDLSISANYKKNRASFDKAYRSQILKYFTQNGQAINEKSLEQI